MSCADHTGNGNDKFEDQRHQFILAYYNMAVADLNRHLGIGWQTLTSVAGVFVLLSIAQEGKLPVPIGVCGAFALAFWGMLNVLDADYWATRAIAFLANVEAVYFYEQDRRIFNPYAGSHPQLKLLDSLKYQLYFAMIAALLSALFYAYKVGENTAWLTQLWSKARNTEPFILVIWLIPIPEVAP